MKAVLDTNVWLDWLVFDDPGLAPLRAAFAEKRLEIVIDAECEAELQRVLGYRFYGKVFSTEIQETCLAECRRIAQRISLNEKQGVLPRCTDPDDQKFLELAAAAGADVLVTKDLELLRLSARALPFRIVRPEALDA